ncbi:hypothetical protein [Streptomyces sp. NPDC046631]|jgi:hypothetical protein|uniref:hypothetical protein n=1 Tax=unclassified Streptomyces TaxID=2593676 RepID=UPI0033FBC750
MGTPNGTAPGWRARTTAFVAAYLRACTVPDAYAASPLAPVPEAALAASRAGAPDRPDVPGRVLPDVRRWRDNRALR